ncbi:hypothetical protein VPNG_03374 [Cytospora leucostoma]|uniref:RRM domain-containing protein n=1 Tax=Cytospora leucostoma TaxID=1230097 RepID=A0A423XFZ7_9PEZI|nr:hypothetical protein VPNG_03374 [Cytospora leucostoma]
MSNSIGGQTVTLDRNYFDTLVRRANFNTEDALLNPLLSISKAEYDGMKQIAAKYANLRQNLLRGGVGEETIDLLSQDDATIEDQKATTAPGPAAMNETHGDSHTPAHPMPYGHVHTREVSDWADMDADAAEDDEDESGGGPVADVPDPVYTRPTAMQPSYERQCFRSVIVTNLPEGVTHSDITEAVRGGQLLDIHIRADRSAGVSFLLASDAQAFFEHVRRRDLYIKNKRVYIRWHDRHLTLSGHVARQISSGATRNLVIRRCDPRLTEKSIREDLDHIDKLVVIKVDFIGGSCYIKTNSVHNAMYARTCMMSRAKYKGSRIEWDLDECAQPYEQPAQARPRKDNLSAKKTDAMTMANRFHLLNLEDDGDEDEMSPDFKAKKTVGIAA